MKKLLLASAALFGLMGAAQAADLPRKSVPFAPLPMFTWTGFYVGVNAGYAFENGSSRLFGTPDLVATGLVPTDRIKGGDGFTGGVQAGFNYQIQQFVLGVEADIQYTDLGRGRATIIGPLTTTQTLGMDYFGTVRGRIGVAFDRFLAYATGGLAYGNYEARTSVSGLGSFWTGSTGEDRIGWTVGVGGEYAFTNNLSLKVEYLYYDLGSKSFNSPLVAGPGAGPTVFGNSRAEFRGNILRAGLNYRF
jgi:outer membrane immunogenic protein